MEVTCLNRNYYIIIMKKMITKKLSSRKYRIVGVWSSLLVLFTISACQNIKGNNAETTDSIVQNQPIFKNFEYLGNDKIYNDNPLPEGRFYNPILQGCYPDPSITRKGDDYYLVSSSFVMFPGVPIFHSKDLVNWKPIGHVLDRESQLKVGTAGISEGIYAPDIMYNRYNDTFYMIT